MAGADPASGDPDRCGDTGGFDPVLGGLLGVRRALTSEPGGSPSTKRSALLDPAHDLLEDAP